VKVDYLKILISKCNELKCLRNQVSMDGTVEEKRREIIELFHRDNLIINAYNELRHIENKMQELELKARKADAFEAAISNFELDHLKGRAKEIAKATLRSYINKVNQELKKGGAE